MLGLPGGVRPRGLLRAEASKKRPRRATQRTWSRLNSIKTINSDSTMGSLGYLTLPIATGEDSNNRRFSAKGSLEKDSQESAQNRIFSELLWWDLE